MVLINYIIKYNCIFRYYLLIVFFFNLIIFYFFGIKRFYANKKINYENKLLDDNDYDLKYSLMLKKIIKIINNPIIFEYQLKQSQKININSDKFIEHQKYLYYIENNKFIKSQKYYKRLKKMMTPYNKNNDEKIFILTKLLCINF